MKHQNAVPEVSPPLHGCNLCVWMQYVHFLQKKYKLGSFDLLSHTAPVQAGVLILAGPFVDYLLTSLRVDLYDYSVPSVVSTPRRRHPIDMFRFAELM